MTTTFLALFAWERVTRLPGPCLHGPPGGLHPLQLWIRGRTFSLDTGGQIPLVPGTVFGDSPPSRPLASPFHQSHRPGATAYAPSQEGADPPPPHHPRPSRHVPLAQPLLPEPLLGPLRPLPTPPFSTGSLVLCPSGNASALLSRGQYPLFPLLEELFPLRATGIRDTPDRVPLPLDHAHSLHHRHEPMGSGHKPLRPHGDDHRLRMGVFRHKLLNLMPFARRGSLRLCPKGHRRRQEEQNHRFQLPRREHDPPCSLLWG